MDFAASNTAATIPLGLPSCKPMAPWISAAPLASCANIEESIRLNPLDGVYGLGHTRWATHGRPTEENAHPHRDCTGEIVVVHNGIIENYIELKHELIAQGHKFVTETDTEVIAHLVRQKHERRSARRSRPQEREAPARRSTFLAILSSRDKNKIVAARWGPPAVVGLHQENEYFVASDIPAVLYHTRDVFFLADGDIAILAP